MSFRTPRPAATRGATRAASTAALGAVIVLSVAGCAAGQRAQTADEYSGVDGVSANVGSIGLRNVGVSSPATVAGYAAKSTATLSMAIVNNGASADQLVSVSTAAAASVSIGKAATAASTPITIPSRGLVQVGMSTGGDSIFLKGLTAPLISGQDIDVTFTFRNAGSTQVRMAVKLLQNYTGGETIDVAPTDS